MTVVAYLLTISDMSSEFMTFKPIMPANKKDLVVVEQKNNWNIRFHDKNDMELEITQQITGIPSST